MSGFKLIAIRPLAGCHERFLKNLTAGVVYKFYQDYIFLDKKGKEISPLNDNLFENKIHVKEPEDYIDIYSSRNININVSTIVGENGSGKSSIIDFYNTLCYYLASNNFKTISLTSQICFNKLKGLLVLTVEYIEVLKPFLKSEFEITKDDVYKLTEKDVKKYTEKIVNHITELFAIYQIQVRFFKKVDEHNFIKLLISYSYEGNEYHSLNSKFSFTDPLQMFIELNNKFIKRIKKIEQEYEEEVLFENDLNQKFNFQLFYEKENKVFCIEKYNDKIELPDYKFFYSILLNYSLHSLNSNIMGNWIFNLFHKNDGYQTPLVINPYRENGNIDINRELKLSIDRLVFNIIDQINNGKEATLLSKYKFNKFLLKRKVKDADRYPINELDFDLKIESTFLDFISKFPYKFHFYEEKNISDYALGYLIKKFRRISNTYMQHFYSYSENSNYDLMERVEKLQEWQQSKTIKFIEENKSSHVTKKLFQTYNFLKNLESYNENLEFIKKWDLDDVITITNDEILIWINFIKEKILNDADETNTDNIVLNLFPNIFDIDIEFLLDDKPIRLSNMSSGEQQYIFNINTITYHINNLKTIKETKENESKIRSYNDVNIILDEIELYYHPQFQKNFVMDIIDSIINLESLNEMKNFNILFLTHSPFILSDIPSSNVLKLKDGLPLTKNGSNAFGANIHDILANDFFLNDGFTGKFSNKYIINLIEEINKIEKLNSEEEFDKYLIMIKIIDEPFIKYKLIEILENKKTYNNQIYLDSLIAQKKKELDNLLSKKRNDKN
ncbi:AAA family ATPase [Flavobacterium pedocola]